MVLRNAIVVTLLGFGLACGPSGTTAPETESEGESEDTGTGTGTGDSDPTTPQPTTVTMTGGNSGTDATPEPGEESDTTPPDPDEGSDTTPPDPDTGEECPLGSENCPCDVGAACDEGLMCNVESGTCVAPPDCRPLDTDPHGDEGSAFELEGLNCGNGMELGVIGTIEGPEVDWYTYFGNESFGCPETPAASISSTEPLDVCVHIECDNGGDVQGLQCGAGSSSADSPDGRAGCCGTDTAVIDDYDCSGFGGIDVNVFVAVASDDRICADYSLEYSY